MYCIPGSVGGGLQMNSGCFGTEFKDKLISLQCIDKKGNIVKVPKEMLPIVDKPLIQYAVEEAANAGIEQFIFVTSRGKSAIENHFDHSFELENNLLVKGKRTTLASAQEMLKIPGSYAYVRQQEPAGLGHAIWCARHLIQNEPFAVILADDLIFGQSTIKEMIENYTSGNMVAIMELINKKFHPMVL